MPTEPLQTAQIRSQVNPNEDAFVFSLLVARNVGATRIAELETLDENGTPTLETQTVDASRPDADAIQSALNAVVAALNDAGFAARANVSQILLGENLAENETAKLVVDVALQKTTPEPKSEISPEIEPFDGENVSTEVE